MKTTLDKLPIDKIAIINDINVDNCIKIRLLDLGIIKNTKIKAIYKSPFNDPTAFLVRGSVIALRNIDTKKINIKYDGDIDGTI